jgi:hypothetical protein
LAAVVQQCGPGYATAVWRAVVIWSIEKKVMTALLKISFIRSCRDLPPDGGRIANPTYAKCQICWSITANHREPLKSISCERQIFVWQYSAWYLLGCNIFFFILSYIKSLKSKVY